MMSEVEITNECGPVLNNPEIICEKCQLSFSRKSNFYRHLRKIHQEHDLDISQVQANNESAPEQSENKIICPHCKLSFKLKDTFYKHMRKNHPGEDIEMKKCKVCGICKEKLRTMLLLFSHLTEKHGVSLQFTEETFYCYDDFLKWKSKIERENQSNFIVTHVKGKNKDAVKLRHYICHRSGFPASLGNKQRHFKRKGIASMKIGSTCPASIHVAIETVEEISCINVKYQSVHVGHELGVRLRLPKEDKARLAASLKAGVSMTCLLKELRDNYSPSHPYRQVTRNDLRNLSRSFKLSKTRVVQRDDFVAVDILVKNILNRDLQNALLVYKPVGEILPENSSVNKDEFLLGIMNDVQEKLLEIYGNPCIMIDHSDCEKFYLSIIIVRDENDESLPVATFFSSKITVELLQPFFDAIHKRLPQFKTKFIMSYDVTSFYNAWQKVFKDDCQHLLCSQFALKNLIRNVESKANQENRRVMKDNLKFMMKEKDIPSFEFMIKKFIKQYENEEKDFITYFKTNYELRTNKWAQCYRIALGMNPDVRLDTWQNQLKSEGKGIISKRLDKTLSLACSFIAKKLISNNIVMDFEKLSARTLLCDKLHVESMSMGNECKIVEVNETKCTISEIINGKPFCYVMEKLTEYCGCDIRCETCSICIHSMSCSCVDYCVHFVICKHMHRFCTSFSPASELVISQESDDSYSFCDNEPIHPFDTDDAMSTEPVCDPQFIIDDIKARIKVQWEVLERKIEDVNYLEVIKNVEERLNSINLYLDDAVPSSSFSNEIPKT